MNYWDEILAQTDVFTPVPEPTWSEFENFDVISPNDVSAAYDGSCWAIDWGRNAVVKISADGEVQARTTPCAVPILDDCRAANQMIHPVAIDCGGDPATCFVADYEGNQVYQLVFNGGSITTNPSNADSYYRPKAIAVQKVKVGSSLDDIVWVADKWNFTPTPAAMHTWTPIPTPVIPTPTPTPPPGATPYTPHPIPTPTSFPEQQRVTMNQFTDPGLFKISYCAIPNNLSVVGDNNDADCWIADRDAGRSGTGENYIRMVPIRDGVPGTEIHIDTVDGASVSRPVDVAPVGTPVIIPTPTPTSGV